MGWGIRRGAGGGLKNVCAEDFSPPPIRCNAEKVLRSAEFAYHKPQQVAVSRSSFVAGTVVIECNLRK